MRSKVTERTLLFVEDDLNLLYEMTNWFRAAGNTVHAADTLEKAEKLLREHRYDMLVLDVVLPDGEGLRLLKNDTALPPAIVLSDLGSEDSILTGFDAGALDYIVKPCSMRLLETRISLRLLPKKDATIELCGLTADANKRTAVYFGRPVSLTSSEFNILWFLMSHPGTFFSADEIYEKVWGAPSLQTTTIRRHLSTLRQKLKELTHENSLIVTEFGKGYAVFTGEAKP